MVRIALTSPRTVPRQRRRTQTNQHVSAHALAPRSVGAPGPDDPLEDPGAHTMSHMHTRHVGAPKASRAAHTPTHPHTLPPHRKKQYVRIGTMATLRVSEASPSTPLKYGCGSLAPPAPVSKIIRPAGVSQDPASPLLRCCSVAAAPAAPAALIAYSAAPVEAGPQAPHNPAGVVPAKPVQWWMW